MCRGVVGKEYLKGKPNCALKIHDSKSIIKEIKSNWSFTPSLYRKNKRQIIRISSKWRVIPNISKQLSSFPKGSAL